MGFRIREHQEKRRKESEMAKLDLLRQEARRFGASHRETPPEIIEQAFLYKVKQARKQFHHRGAAMDATDLVCQSLRKLPDSHKLPISSVDLQMVLDLL